MNKSKIIMFNIIALIVIVIIGFAITPIKFQNDTFYTIKIGEHIVNNGINMQDDPFSWHENLPYTFPHWAYDVIIFGIYNLSGFCGLYIVTTILSIILGIIIYFTNVKLNKNHIVSIIITILTMLLFKNYIAARAQLVTFILFALTILFIEKFLETRKLKYAVGLVVIPIIIANVHLAVWPFYFILFLPYITEYIVAIIYEKFIDKKGIGDSTKLIVQKNNNTKWLIVILIISAFTGLLTPLGFTPYTYLIKTMQGTTMKNISEHTPLVLFNKKEILLVILAFIIFFTFTKAKVRMCDLFMLTGLTVLAFSSNRQLSMLILIGNIILVRIIWNYILQNIQNEEEFNKIKKHNNHIILEIIIYVSVVIVTILGGFGIYNKQKNDKFVDNTLYPVEASKWIKQNLNLEEIRLFNEYNYGSYLIYEGIPVFIDSRADLYTSEFNKTKEVKGRNIFDDFINISSMSTYYHTIFEQYDITHVILLKRSKLDLALRYDERYEDIYNDDYFVVYEIKK